MRDQVSRQVQLKEETAGKTNGPKRKKRPQPAGLDWSRADNIQPFLQKGFTPSSGSLNRLPQGVLPAAKRSWTFRRLQ